MSSYWFYILLAVIVLAVGILVVLYLVLRKARRKLPLAEATIEPSALAEVQRGEAAPIEFIKYDLASNLGLRASFAKALRVLKAHVAGRDFRYRIPWFLMIGEAQSGKTTLLGNTGMNLPLGRTAEHVRGIKQGLNWCFFDKGIVLDISGEYLMQPGGEVSDGAGWNTISKLLRKHRPQRPLDGIILTIPCTDLIAARNLGPEHRVRLENKAACLYKKLWQAQKMLGLSFPVYILITKCDEVAGFKSLCQEVPPQLQNDIFGWSSPYTLETAYKSEWVDEAFRSLHRYLFQIQIEVFAERGEVQDGDGLFLLPSEMQSLRAPLQVYLDHLFKESSFHDSFFFRGLYFCGDGSHADAPAQAGLLPNETEPPLEWLAQSPDPFEPLPVIPTEPAARKPAFLKQLFESKIFHEDLLARPVAKTMLSRNRTVLVAQALSLLIPLIGGLGILVTYGRLQQRENELHALLVGEASDLNERLAKTVGNRPLMSAGGQNTMMTPVAYAEPELGGRMAPEIPLADPSVSEVRDDEGRLLYAMAKADGGKFTSPFIPTSWFSGLNRRTEDSFVAAFKYLVLNALRDELDARTDRLVNADAVYARPLRPDPVGADEEFYAHARDPVSSAPKDYERPVVSAPEFELRQFVEQLGALILNRTRYERVRMKGDGTFEDLGALVEYLGHAPLPDDFDKGNELFKKALERAEGRPLQTTDVHQQGAVKVTEIIDDIYLNSFDERGVTYSYLTEIGETEALLNKPAYTWLSTYVSTNPRFAFYSMTVLSSLRELRKSLEGLSNKEFMSDDPALRAAARAPLRRRLIWNKEPLQRALALHQEYQTFIGGKHYGRSEKLDTSVRQAALNELKEKVSGLIKQSQVYQPAERVPGESILKSSIAAEIKNFVETQDILLHLLEICDGMGMDVGLRRAITDQLSYLVRAIDREFHSARFYVPRQEDFDWWDGGKTVSTTAFGVSGPAELAAYLDIQRKQIASLGRDLAMPIYTFLSAHRDIAPQLLQGGFFTTWNEILTELDNYDTKKPGNSVAALENFIRVEMDRASADDCSVLNRLSNESFNDFFIVRRNELRRQLSGRCDQLAEFKTHNEYLKTLKDYKDIEEFFNRHLAGRFPFADITDAQTFAEADPDQLRAFFGLLDAKEQSASDALARGIDFGVAQSESKEAIQFLDTMKEVRAFFAEFIEKKQFPALDYDVQLRVNAKDERGGDNIIEWNLEVGKKRISLFDEDHTGRWLYGQPVRLTLRWAYDGPAVPVQSTTVPQIKVLDRTAILEYNNRWSLLAMLMRHRGNLLRHRGDPAPDSVEYLDVEPETLKFTVRTRAAGMSPPLSQAQRDELSTDSAEVFMRLSLLAPNKKEPLILPSSFPTKAPRLTSGTVRARTVK